MPVTLSFNGANPTGSGTLRYPKVLYESHTDYVRFDFYKYKPPFSAIAGATPAVNAATGAPAPAAGGGLSNYNASSEGLEKAAGLETILLYMPEDISTGTSIEWTGKGFSNVAADILRGSSIPNGTATAGGGAAAVTQAITAAGQRGASIAADALAKAINGLPGGIGGDVNMQDILGGVGGVILNPNTELMFGGFGLRSFSLKFKMSPRSKEEAIEIKKICNSFRIASLPEYGQSPSGVFGGADKFLAFFTNPGGQGGTSDGAADDNKNYIGVPNLCRVTFMSGSNPNRYIAQYKACAINSVDINYTPDGSYATFGGNVGADERSPVATELAISFTETKLLYRSEVSIDGGSF